MKKQRPHDQPALFAVQSVSANDPISVTLYHDSGHMGIFDAQIVVQSVENVIAVDESEIRKSASKPR